MKTLVTSSFFLLASSFTAQASSLPLSETLVGLRAFHQPSYAWKQAGVAEGADTLTIEASDKEARRFVLCGVNDQHHPYFPWYVAGDEIKITFEYRASVDGRLNWSGRTLDIRRPDGWSGSEKKLPKAAEWTQVTWTFKFPACCLYEQTLGVTAEKGVGALEIRKLRVTETPRTDGAPLLIGGEKVTSIVMLPTDDPQIEFAERRAAQIFRLALRRAGGPLLDYVEVKDVKDAPKAAVFVGRAAEQAGILTAADQKMFKAAKRTSGAWRVKGARLGIAGNVPAGSRFAAFLAFQALGIDFLANDVCVVAKPGEFALADGAGEAKTRGISHTLFQRRSGLLMGLLGGENSFENYANLDYGSVFPPSGWGMTHDSLGAIISLKEFEKDHPEYFSFTPAGERMSSKKFGPGHTQFCWGNKELRRLVGERFVEIMKATPYQKNYYLAPGDGGENYCHCEICKAKSNTDNMVEFANDVAAITAKTFPDKNIMICSYVDTVAGPTVAAHPNVKVNITYYHPAYWPASSFYTHPANEPGLKALADWRKIFPDAGPEPYLMNCREWMEAWPGFDAYLELMRDASRHGAYVFDATYCTSEHVSIPAGIACANACFYLMARLAIDPEYDVESGKKRYFAQYYGPAAELMLRYIARLEKARIDQDWVQNTEFSRRGFVRADWAEEVFAIFDAAEKAAGTEGPWRDRVLAEEQKFLCSYLLDVNRSRGTVPKGGFETWAKRVAKYALICRERKVDFMCMGASGFFKVVTLATPKLNANQSWTDERQEEINKLIADPVGYLGAAVPLAQEKTATGWKIPVKAITGGVGLPKCNWCREKAGYARQLRRPSSGDHKAITALRLDAAPTKAIVLSFEGIDCEKTDVATMSVTVNGKELYAGKVPFAKDKWTPFTLSVPAEVWMKGENEIVIANTLPDKEKDGLCGAAFAAKHDYFWGWFMLGDLTLEAK